MFDTQEKVLKRIQQDRMRGDSKRALEKALEGIEKWSDDFNLMLEAIQLSVETSDMKQAVTLMKTAIRKFPKSRSNIMEMAEETLQSRFNPFLSSFLIETFMRSRDIERVRNMLRLSPPNYAEDLIKRSEIRSKGFQEGKEEKSSQYTDNEILLAVLYMTTGAGAKAAVPLGRAMANSAEDAQLIGSILVELEREHPNDAEIKFYLGLASILLSHLDKAESRFFQCLQCPSPPLDRILDLIKASSKPFDNHLLLMGETLIRSGKTEVGISCIKDYLEGKGPSSSGVSAPGGDPFGGAIDKRELALGRLSILPAELHGRKEIAFLCCSIEAALEKVKEAVAELENLYGSDPSSGPAIASWITDHAAVCNSAPAQKLLTRLHIAGGNAGEATRAAVLAAEMNPALTGELIGILQEACDSSGEPDLALIAAQAELSAMCGNSERAEDLIKKLETNETIDNSELFKLKGKIIDKCGINLDRVISAIGLGIRNSSIEGAVTYAVQFFKNNPDAHNEFVSRIEQLAEGKEEAWKSIASLTELMSKEEQLSRPFRALQAKARMKTGDIERAIFEFDQLMMYNESMRLDLIPLYEEAARARPENTTLNLAIYQLNLDEEFYSRAAHYLCKALESDPSQIRHVVSGFTALVEKEPGNREIWEEMLKSALALNHVDLAKEVMNRAMTSLPEKDAAALQVYSARICAADGRSMDGLRALEKALGADNADLPAVEAELRGIIAKEPANPVALYLLGRTLMATGSEDQGISEFERCLSLSDGFKEQIRTKLESHLPFSIKPWLLSRILGEISWKDGRIEDAYRYFNNSQKGPAESLDGLNDTLSRIKSSSPGDRRISSLYARNLSLTRRYDESVAALLELYRSDAGSSGRIMEILNELLQKVPMHFEGNRLLARMWIDRGQIEDGLGPILNMLSDTKTDQNEVDGAAKEFLHLYGGDSRFLVPFAHLKNRLAEHGAALESLRKAFSLEPGCWEKVLPAAESIAWPKDRSFDAALLRADCRIEGGMLKEAYAVLEELRTSDEAGRRTEAMLQRYKKIISKGPDAGGYMSACILLARSGKFEAADEILREGCRALPQVESAGLKIGLAETLESLGRKIEAATLYREVLNENPDRIPILRKIEKSTAAWYESEISLGMKKLAEGSGGAEYFERIARTAIEAGEFEKALEIAEGAGLTPDLGRLLRARAYLGMDRPAAALALTAACAGNVREEGDYSIELCTIEGLACEMLGDYGRAASAFARSLALGGTGNIGNRAEINYTRYLESQFEERPEILVKTGDLHPVQNERKQS